MEEFDRNMKFKVGKKVAVDDRFVWHEGKFGDSNVLILFLQNFLSDKMREKILREFEITAEIKHPSVVEVVKVARAKVPYVVLLPFEGENLFSVLSEGEEFAPLIAARVGRQLASLFQALRDKNKLRAVKMEDVFFDTHLNLKVLKFSEDEESEEGVVFFTTAVVVSLMSGKLVVRRNEVLEGLDFLKGKLGVHFNRWKKFVVEAVEGGKKLEDVVAFFDRYSDEFDYSKLKDMAFQIVEMAEVEEVREEQRAKSSHQALQSSKTPNKNFEKKEKVNMEFKGEMNEQGVNKGVNKGISGRENTSITLSAPPRNSQSLENSAKEGQIARLNTEKKEAGKRKESARGSSGGITISSSENSAFDKILLILLGSGVAILFALMWILFF